MNMRYDNYRKFTLKGYINFPFTTNGHLQFKLPQNFNLTLNC
jgi:hypothetical protein